MKLDTIKAMERIARGDSSVISLGQGIPSGQLDTVLQQAAIEAVKKGCADAYSDPQGLLELRQVIAASTHNDEGLNYKENEIIITVGAIEAINVAIRSALTDTRKKVIIPTPAYSAYFSLVTSAGGTVRQLPLNELSGWTLPVKRLKRSLTKDTAAILLCNPNNPTGVVYDKETLRQVAQLAKDADVPLIIDEVYRHILYDGNDFYSPAEDDEFKDTVIRIMSFSKDFNMTGWRVGYIQASQTRIPHLTAIHDGFVNCSSVISQYVAIAAMQESKRIFTSNQRLYTRRKQQMQAWLERVKGVAGYHVPAAGYFFFPRLKSDLNSYKAAREFAKQGIVTIPGSAFGAGGEGHIRLCFGRSSEAINQGMQKLVQYYDK
jgi:aminotransferase